jgi:hypothetical protein
MKDWLRPVDSKPDKAMCIKCKVIIDASHETLTSHVESEAHKTNAGRNNETESSNDLKDGVSFYKLICLLREVTIFFSFYLKARKQHGEQSKISFVSIELGKIADVQGLVASD